MDKVKTIVEKKKKILYRFFFVLLKPGKVKITNEEGKSVDWNVARPSEVKSVIAFDMDMACKKMRKILEKKKKKGWDGFQLMDVKEDQRR